MGELLVLPEVWRSVSLWTGKLLLKIRKKMSSPATSVKHIGSVIQHTIELNVDVLINDRSKTLIYRTSPMIRTSIILPDSKCTYYIQYFVIDRKPAALPPLAGKERFLFIVIKDVKKYIN